MKVRLSSPYQLKMNSLRPALKDVNDITLCLLRHEVIKSTDASDKQFLTEIEEELKIRTKEKWALNPHQE